MAAPVAAQDKPRVVEDMTRGLRFSPPFQSLAESPSDPNVLYVGSQWGRVYVTRDGGMTWDENFAHTSRNAFYGAIRPQAPPQRVITTNITFGGRAPGSLIEGQTTDGQFTTNTAPGRDARSAAVLAHFDRLYTREEDGPEGGVAGAGARLGVGLRNTAPWLAIAVRKKRRWGVGIRLQQTLALKAAPATNIGYLDVDPRDPDVALAATADGILKSTDGGYSWPTVMTGALPAQRYIHHMLRHPEDPDVLYAATGLGLRMSHDAGESWAPVVHGLVAINDTRWVAIDPNDTKVIYVGLSWALVKSDDGGENFRIIFDHPWPAAAMVRRVLVDPHDSRRVLMATADGLFVSEDAGEKWERTGGLVMTGADTIVLSAGPEPGHFLTGNLRDLWETWDAGKTWQIAYFAPIEWDVRWAVFSRHTKGAIWIVTSGEILKMVPRAPGTLAPEVLVRFRELVGREMPVGGVVQRALRRAGVDRPTVNRTRRRAVVSGLMPRITAAVWKYDRRIDVEVLNRKADANTESARREVYYDIVNWGVFARWDLAKALHSQDEAVSDRVGSLNRWAEWKIRQTVINLYQERRRLQFEALAEPGGERAGLMRALRVEELTAHINALAGDVLPQVPAF